jgi:hypothetical protein
LPANRIIDVVGAGVDGQLDAPRQP